MSLPLLIAPALLAAAALLMAHRPPARGARLLRVPEIAALGALVIALAAGASLWLSGPVTSPLIGFAGIGLSVRLDIVSVAMALTVAFVGWIVLRFSRVAMDGEARQPAFMGWMSATIACVLLLVTAGNVVQLALGWVATGAALHRLLLFYSGRWARSAPRARRL